MILNKFVLGKERHLWEIGIRRKWNLSNFYAIYRRLLPKFLSASCGVIEKQIKGVTTRNHKCSYFNNFREFYCME